jgi:hypothetical protein
MFWIGKYTKQETNINQSARLAYALTLKMEGCVFPQLLSRVK